VLLGCSFDMLFCFSILEGEPQSLRTPSPVGLVVSLEDSGNYFDLYRASRTLTRDSNAQSQKIPNPTPQPRRRRIPVSAGAPTTQPLNQSGADAEVKAPSCVAHGSWFGVDD
jgi:hypothetical protein